MKDDSLFYKSLQEFKNGLNRTLPEFQPLPLATTNLTASLHRESDLVSSSLHREQDTFHTIIEHTINKEAAPPSYFCIFLNLVIHFCVISLEIRVYGPCVNLP